MFPMEFRTGSIVRTNAKRSGPTGYAICAHAVFADVTTPALAPPIFGRKKEWRCVVRLIAAKRVRQVFIMVTGTSNEIHRNE